MNATGLALSLPDTFLSGASHTVKAVYTNIDGNFLGNNSTNLTQTVQTVAVEPDPSNPTLTDLFIGSNGATSNDTILVNPVGSSNTGSTGVTVQTTLNGVTVKTTYSQSFSTIYAFLQNGSENVQLANTLTINTVVTAGNGNDNVQLGNGNNVVTLGNGNDNIQAGSGSNTVMAGNGNDNIQAGSGSNTVMAGNGNDNVQAGSGSNTVTRRTRCGGQRQRQCLGRQWVRRDRRGQRQRQCLGRQRVGPGRRRARSAHHPARQRQ